MAGTISAGVASEAAFAAEAGDPVTTIVDQRWRGFSVIVRVGRT